MFNKQILVILQFADRLFPSAPPPPKKKIPFKLATQEKVQR